MSLENKVAHFQFLMARLSDWDSFVQQQRWLWLQPKRKAFRQKTECFDLDEHQMGSIKMT